MFSLGSRRILLSRARHAANQHITQHQHPRANPIGQILLRCLHVHEYIAMEVFQSFGIKTPDFQVASTPEEAEDIFLHTFNKRTCKSIC